MNLTDSGAARRVFTPSDVVDVARYDDEYVLLHRTRDAYFGLDAVGAEVWDLLVEGRDDAAITDALAARYDVDRERVAGDVAALVAELLAAELIRPG